jgi:hypothetical protein
VNITTDTFGPGRAGDITINADTFVAQNGALISASTGGEGAGGNISIRANSVFMQGGQSTSVITTFTGMGQPGLIDIQADKLTLLADAQIIANTFGVNPAGAIHISAHQVSIDGSGGATGEFTGLSVDSEITSSQRAGDITVNADKLIIQHGGQITSTSATDSPGGDIFLNARGIRLVDSDITAQAGGDGGNVHLTAARFVSLFKSQISASSIDGNGGEVLMDPPVVALNHSELSASAVHGNGGDVSIASSFFLRSDTTIMVSSVFGAQGTVTIPSPLTEISGSLLPLKVEPLDVEDALYPDCAARLPGGISSFVVTSRSGLPVGPESFLPALDNPRQDSRKDSP